MNINGPSAYEKSATIELSFEYLSHALTAKGIEEGFIDFNNVINIKEVSSDPQDMTVVFECDVLREIGH